MLRVSAMWLWAKIIGLSERAIMGRDSGILSREVITLPGDSGTTLRAWRIRQMVRQIPSSVSRTR